MVRRCDGAFAEAPTSCYHAFANPGKQVFYLAVAQLFSEHNLGFGPYSFGGSEGHARSTPIEKRTAASAAIKIKKVGLSSRLARSKVGMLIPQSRCAGSNARPAKRASQ